MTSPLTTIAAPPAPEGLAPKGPALERPAPARTRARLAGAATVSAALSLALLATSLGSASRLGAPAYWPWLLTGLQVTALWAAGGNRWWGWPLGAAVQPPWIVYAVLTGQLGFIPGCVVSCVVQAVSFARAARRIVPPSAGPRGASALAPG